MQNLLYYLIFSAVLVSGLFIHYRNAFASPPPWAPAHGYREKHSKHHREYYKEEVVKKVYYYYPTQQVYFNPQTQQYFWLQAGNWTLGYKLPTAIQVASAAPVTLNLATDRPYAEHAWIKQKYPGK